MWNSMCWSDPDQFKNISEILEIYLGNLTFLGKYDTYLENVTR